MPELRAHPDERAPWVEGVGEHVEHCAPLLQQLEEPAVGMELVGSRNVEQAGRTADEEAPCLLGNRLAEGRPERLDELSLPWRQALIVELATERARSELESRQLLV